LLCASDFADQITTVNLDDQTLTTLAVPGLEPSYACYSPANDLFIIWCYGTNGIKRVTPEPLAILDGLSSITGTNAISVVYNATNGLVYINVRLSIVVYNPVTNTVVGSFAAGVTIGGFVGGITLDEPNNLLWVAFHNGNLFPAKGFVVALDISAAGPVLASSTELPFDSGGGSRAFGAAWCPSNGLVYCFGEDEDTNIKYLTRYNPQTGLFHNSEVVPSVPGDAVTVLYQPSADLLFVPDSSGAGVDVYCPLTDAKIGSVAVDRPEQGCLIRGGAFAYMQPGGVISYL
jgi:hypothetical protein